MGTVKFALVKCVTRVIKTDNLSQHKQNCSKKITYNCEQCSKSFTRRDCKIMNFHIHGI